MNHRPQHDESCALFSLTNGPNDQTAPNAQTAIFRSLYLRKFFVRVGPLLRAGCRRQFASCRLPHACQDWAADMFRGWRIPRWVNVDHSDGRDRFQPIWHSHVPALEVLRVARDDSQALDVGCRLNDRVRQGDFRTVSAALRNQLCSRLHNFGVDLDNLDPKVGHEIVQTRDIIYISTAIQLHPSDRADGRIVPVGQLVEGFLVSLAAVDQKCWCRKELGPPFRPHLPLILQSVSRNIRPVRPHSGHLFERCHASRATNLDRVFHVRFVCRARVENVVID